MGAFARWKGDKLNIGRKGLIAAAFLGFTQFCVNFNAVYLAERHITSGVVATVFALLLIPASLLAWLLLGHRPSARFSWSSVVAVTGIALLFVHEIRQHPADRSQIAAGIGLTLVGMLGAAIANVWPGATRDPSRPAILDVGVVDGRWSLDRRPDRLRDDRPPHLRPALVLLGGCLVPRIAGVGLTFSLYYPVVRKIGPAKAAYSSVIVPIIAMGFSTWLEDYRWTPLTIAGAALALGGMVAALSRSRSPVPSPDAA